MEAAGDWEIAVGYVLRPGEGDWLTTSLRVIVQASSVVPGQPRQPEASLPLQPSTSPLVQLEPVADVQSGLILLAQTLMNRGQLGDTFARYPSFPDMERLASDIAANTRVPVFGSPPEAWRSLADLATAAGAGTVAVVTGGGRSPVGILLVLAGSSLYVEVGRPVLRAVGRNLGAVVDLYFERRLGRSQEVQLDNKLEKQPDTPEFGDGGVHL